MDEQRQGSGAGARGLQISVQDPALQAYLQRYPFASGPDAESNARGLAAAAAVRVRGEVAETEAVRLRPEETLLADEEEARLQAMFEELGWSAEAQRRYRDDFGWEVNLVPRSARRVLVVGCGDGVELVFLRAVLPGAEVTALDYGRSLLEGVERAVGEGFRFLGGDLHERMAELPREFDLAFSNHTMEHMYAPERTLGLIAGRLVEGGHLVSTQPLMGQPGSPWLERVRAQAEEGESGERRAVHPLDAVFFDLGHPWKTTVADLRGTVEAAGFEEVRVYQREGHVCRPGAMSEAELRQRRRVHGWFYAGLLAPVRAAGKGVWAALGGPGWMARALFGVERRLGFGVNRTMNELSEEACVVGRRGCGLSSPEGGD